MTSFLGQASPIHTCYGVCFLFFPTSPALRGLDREEGGFPSHRSSPPVPLAAATSLGPRCSPQPLYERPLAQWPSPRHFSFLALFAPRMNVFCLSWCDLVPLTFHKIFFLFSKISPPGLSFSNIPRRVPHPPPPLPISEKAVSCRKFRRGTLFLDSIPLFYFPNNFFFFL